jgi:hypothetical protein
LNVRVVGQIGFNALLHTVTDAVDGLDIAFLP